jgi:hypothetical protein
LPIDFSRASVALSSIVFLSSRGQGTANQPLLPQVHLVVVLKPRRRFFFVLRVGACDANIITKYRKPP